MEVWMIAWRSLDWMCQGQGENVTELEKKLDKRWLQYLQQLALEIGQCTGARGNNVTTQAKLIFIACRQGIEHTSRSHLSLTMVETNK